MRCARDVQRDRDRTHGATEDRAGGPHRVQRVDDRSAVNPLQAQCVCVLSDVGDPVDAPAMNSAAASVTADGASAAMNTNTAIPMPTTATLAERKRRIERPAAKPATSAPPENAAIATPYAALDSPRSALISG